MIAEIPTTLKTYRVKSFTLKYKAMEEPPKRDVLSSPERVAVMARGIFNELDGGSSVEHFAVCFLNIQNELIGFKAFNTGTVDQVATYPRLIIHTALMVGAAGIILVHNHPSGQCVPSEDDKRLTRSIVDGSRVFDIRVLDHLVISMTTYKSFREIGII